ncbi:hypothetical protein SUGI_0538920 [Cryptomeria japonica]|uniref:18.1 kDa class I heat shock protein-like n=1 Tax=Cryptomeria japonica TaxID=3369 RepID=UPI002408BB62|nr:18.1 kDa class I heat shock protein-like [Cryptomeria japonica]GLJ27457.1 hypothetical protein SUGI_0538920 [Cryptomeria japonica]
MALTPFFGRGISAWDPWENNLFDPWLPISRVWDAMDFSVPTSASSFSRDAMAMPNTRADWKETPEAHVFTTNLLGLRKEDLKIDLVEKNTLRISRERHKEQEEKTDQWHRVERSSGRFMRQFRLPENVNVDDIFAKLENRVLTVNAPKTQPDAANGSDVKSIDIGSA